MLLHIVSGEILGQLCRSRGVEVFLSLRDVVFTGIQSNLERGLAGSTESPVSSDDVEGATRECERVSSEDINSH